MTEEQKNKIDQDNEEKEEKTDHSGKEEIEKENDKNENMEENVENNKDTETENQEFAETEEKQTETDEDSALDDLSPQEKVERLKEELEEQIDEKKKYKKQLQRLKADFINYRKRMEREKNGLELKAKIELLEEIIPVIDNFERALNSEEDKKESQKNYKEGVEMIYRQLLNSLKQEGLETIVTEDEEFDPKYHEAIMQIEDSDKDSGIIVEELQKGYIYCDKVIRPAMVKVAK